MTELADSSLLSSSVYVLLSARSSSGSGDVLANKGADDAFAELIVAPTPFIAVELPAV
jgi:hypothetical protein